MSASGEPTDDDVELGPGVPSFGMHIIPGPQATTVRKGGFKKGERKECRVCGKRWPKNEPFPCGHLYVVATP